MNQNIQNALLWRYATKKYDVSKKLTTKQFDTVIDSMRLAPSSTGLQPWGFVDVQTPELRLKLRAAAWNQSAITDADHLIVMCSIKDLGEKNVDEYIESVSKTRGVAVDSLNGYKDMIMKNIAGKTAEQIEDWSTKQVYIALGFGLLTSALANIDSTPMEGFDKKKFDEILGLEAKGLKSQVLLAVGVRASDDETANYKKVRYGRDRVVKVM